ncbi:LbtU family siderophore porin [Candidatus Nitrospira neomarina]|uniref:LbtU family siderophore porin n=1 Tax=Candidatus Nitrospira neomarina TaxID=3020899 RepID=A0AA96GQ68_9BACT|nr:LbtU family siderophore porin [Candidatus Nitrospira neomarina]WNM61586.1 LbtU family siderophore porin [Candidatus Nitrospira neomarina]
MTILRVGFLGWALLMCLVLPNLATAQEEPSIPEKSSNGEDSSKDKLKRPPSTVRIYRSPEERREAAAGTQLTPWLKFGAVVDIEKEWQTNNFKNGIKTVDNPDTELAIELGFEITSIEWLEAELLFAIEDNGSEHYQEVDEGLIGVDLDDFGAKVGLLYLPFGEFYSHFVTGPLVEFAQTRGPGLIVDYTLWDALELSAYTFYGKVDKKGHSGRHQFDWGLAAEFVNEDESIRIGGGYISDLGEGDADFFLDFNNTFQQHVPGWTAHGLIALPPFEFTGEIVHATEAIKEFDQNADKPLTYNLELAYYPSQFPWIQFALRYEHSTELEDEPQEIYGIGTSLRPLDNLSLSFEYLRGTFKNNFSLDDNDNVQTSYDLIAIAATFLF